MCWVWIGYTHHIFLQPSNTFSRESKYEIKGSKSRSVREKNVIYRNLKNAICKVKSWKMTKDAKNSTKTRGLYGRTTGEKKWQKIDDFKGLFGKKKWFREKITFFKLLYKTFFSRTLRLLEPLISYFDSRE